MSFRHRSLLFVLFLFVSGGQAGDFTFDFGDDAESFNFVMREPEAPKVKTASEEELAGCRELLFGFLDTYKKHVAGLITKTGRAWTRQDRSKLYMLADLQYAHNDLGMKAISEKCVKIGAEGMYVIRDFYVELSALVDAAATSKMTSNTLRMDARNSLKSTAVVLMTAIELVHMMGSSDEKFTNLMEDPNGPFWDILRHIAVSPWLVAGDSFSGLGMSGVRLRDDQCGEFLESCAEAKAIGMFSNMKIAVRRISSYDSSAGVKNLEFCPGLRGLESVYRGMNYYERMDVLVFNFGSGSRHQEWIESLRPYAEDDFRGMVELVKRTKDPSMLTMRQKMKVLAALEMLGRKEMMADDTSSATLNTLLTEEPFLVRDLMNAAVLSVDKMFTGLFNIFVKNNFPASKKFTNASFYGLIYHSDATAVLVNMLGHAHAAQAKGEEDAILFSELLGNMLVKKKGFNSKPLRAVLALALHMVETMDSDATVTRVVDGGLAEMLVSDMWHFVNPSHDEDVGKKRGGGQHSRMMKLAVFLLHYTFVHGAAEISVESLRAIREKLDLVVATDNDIDTKVFKGLVETFTTVASDNLCDRSVLLDREGVTAMQFSPFVDELIRTSKNGVFVAKKEMITLLEKIRTRSMFTCSDIMADVDVFIGSAAMIEDNVWRQIGQDYQVDALLRPWLEEKMFGEFYPHAEDMAPEEVRMELGNFINQFNGAENPLRKRFLEVAFYFYSLAHHAEYMASTADETDPTAVVQVDLGFITYVRPLFRRIFTSAIGIGTESFHELKYESTENSKALEFLPAEVRRVWVTNTHTVDDAEQLFIFGEWTQGSCQAIYGQPQYNIGVLGTMASSVTKLVTATTHEFTGADPVDVPLAARSQVRVVRHPRFDAVIVAEGAYFAKYLPKTPQARRKALGFIATKLVSLVEEMNAAAGPKGVALIVTADTSKGRDLYVEALQTAFYRSELAGLEFRDRKLYSNYLGTEGRLTITGGIGPSYVDTNEGVFVGAVDLVPENVDRGFGIFPARSRIPKGTDRSLAEIEMVDDRTSHEVIGRSEGLGTSAELGNETEEEEPAILSQEGNGDKGAVKGGRGDDRPLASLFAPLSNDDENTKNEVDATVEEPSQRPTFLSLAGLFDPSSDTD